MSARHIFKFIMIPIILFASHGSLADQYRQQRQDMIDAIITDLEDTAKYVGQKSFNEAVLRAMSTVPRHKFIPDDQLDRAYENEPLPIGFGQTISQPYIVALMTDLLRPQADHRVLEIGTGSGYQAAILAGLVAEVYSIEIIEPLGRKTTRLLSQLNYNNIETRIADGYNGWPEHAPFDSIIVTAAISHIPPPLVAQLKNGGRMLIPVGTRFQTQYLTLVEKNNKGEVTTRQVLPVYFVPFTGGH